MSQVVHHKTRGEHCPSEREFLEDGSLNFVRRSLAKIQVISEKNSGFALFFFPGWQWSVFNSEQSLISFQRLLYKKNRRYYKNSESFVWHLVSAHSAMTALKLTVINKKMYEKALFGYCYCVSPSLLSPLQLLRSCLPISSIHEFFALCCLL